MELFRLVRTANGVPWQLSQAEGHASIAAHVGLVFLRTPLFMVSYSGEVDTACQQHG